MEPSAGLEPARSRGRSSALYPLSYEGMPGYGNQESVIRIRMGVALFIPDYRPLITDFGLVDRLLPAVYLLGCRHDPASAREVRRRKRRPRRGLAVAAVNFELQTSNFAMLLSA